MSNALFNSEATLARPAADIERISVLQARRDYFDAQEAYLRVRLRKDTGLQVDVYEMKARLITWFDLMSAMLQRALPEDDYEDLQLDIWSEEFDGLRKAAFMMNQFLDKIRLTRIDTDIQVDRTDAAAVDEVMGV